MNDGVGMDPEDRETETNTASSASDKRQANDAAAGQATKVTGWSGAAGGTSVNTKAGSSPNGDQETVSGSGTRETFDPAMADEPAEGGVEEAEE